MRRIRQLALLLLVAAGIAGCSARGGQVYQERTTVRVENRNFLDMTIYVVRSSQRVRLGSTPGLSVRTFTIPDRLVFGTTPLRFVADPLGGQATPVSQEITVTPGDEVVLYIPS